MGQIKLTPALLEGSLAIPPSKSMSHRSIICAALAEGTSQVSNLIYSDDICVTLNAMEALGAVVVRGKSDVKITGIGTSHPSSKTGPEEIEIYCKESGSTLRFMIPIAMSFGGIKKFTGSGRLVERPLTAYQEILERQGTAYEYNGQLPLKVSGKLESEDFKIKGDESSQYISGLLMALPLLGGDGSVEVTGHFESEDYVALTTDMMKHYGVPVKVQDGRLFSLKSSNVYKSQDYRVEADYSQGAFFLVAGQIGRAVHCEGLIEHSKQADRRVVEIIRAMGGSLKKTDTGILSSPSETTGTLIDASQCPDIIPVLCVLAALSKGETRVINGQRLRIKESDRIQSTVSELRKLGALIEETEDGMVIQGQPMLKGGRVDSWNDHRIAMAMAVASIRCTNPVVIEGAQSVSKSYPHFFEDFKSLGGRYE